MSPWLSLLLVVATVLAVFAETRIQVKMRRKRRGALGHIESDNYWFSVAKALGRAEAERIRAEQERGR